MWHLRGNLKSSKPNASDVSPRTCNQTSSQTMRCPRTWMSIPSKKYLALRVQFSKIKLHKCKIPRNCVCVKRLLISSSQKPQNSNHERLVCQTLGEQLRTTKNEKTNETLMNSILHN